MFKWWNEPILPRSQVKWSYPVIVAILWVTAKYSINRGLVATEVAMDLLTVLFASIALASFQTLFSRKPPEQPQPTPQAKASQQKAKQRKRKAKRHP